MKVQRLSYVWWVREADSLYTTLPLPAALADPIFSFALISAASLRSPGNVYLSFVSEDRLCLRSPLFPEVFPPAFPRSQPQSWISPARISLCRATISPSSGQHRGGAIWPILQSSFPPWKDLKKKLQRSNSQPCRHGAGEGARARVCCHVAHQTQTRTDLLMNRTEKTEEEEATKCRCSGGDRMLRR